MVFRSRYSTQIGKSNLSPFRIITGSDMVSPMQRKIKLSYKQDTSTRDTLSPGTPVLLKSFPDSKFEPQWLKRGKVKEHSGFDSYLVDSQGRTFKNHIKELKSVPLVVLPDTPVSPYKPKIISPVNSPLNNSPPPSMKVTQKTVSRDTSPTCFRELSSIPSRIDLTS